MGDVRVIEVKESVFADNDRKADELRGRLRQQGTFLLNLMSSPGSGKTTTLTRTIEALGGELGIAVMEADIDSDVDARTIAGAGARAIQVHTGGMCHLDAYMTEQGLDALLAEDPDEHIDLAILENVGNLVCPAEFDTGASANAMILSVPEGDDKPLKYPGVFQASEAIILNKVDTMEVFNFNEGAFRDAVTQLNPAAPIFPISATKGAGVDEWADWLRAKIEAFRA